MSSIKLGAQQLKGISNLKITAAAWRKYTINLGYVMNSWTDYGNWFALALAGCTQDPDRFYPSMFMFHREINTRKQLKNLLFLERVIWRDVM
jgi:hypothetical protein